MRRILGILIATTAISAAAFAECSDSNRKSLEAFDRAWSAAGVNGDRGALMNIYADDYIGLPGMQDKTVTINGTMKTFETNKGNRAMASKTTFDNYLINCTPVSATITHRNTVWTPIGTGGKSETSYSRSVHVLENRNGKWQVVSSAGNALDDSAAIWYLEQDWNNAILKRNKEWFEKNYASDFSSVSSTSAKLMNRAEDISDTIDDKGTMDLAETSDMNIRVDGNTAIVTGVFRTKGKDAKGSPFDRKTRYTDVWIKRDGRWQAWGSSGTTIPTPVETAKK